MNSKKDAAMRGRIGALRLHAMYDGRDTTAKARETFLARFLAEVDPYGILSPDERERRAMYARRAYFARLAYLSATSRGKKRRARQQTRDVEAAA